MKKYLLSLLVVLAPLTAFTMRNDFNEPGNKRKYEEYEYEAEAESFVASLLNDDFSYEQPASESTPALLPIPSKLPPPSPTTSLTLPSMSTSHNTAIIENSSIEGCSSSSSTSEESSDQESLYCKLCDRAFKKTYGKKFHLRSKGHKQKVAAAASQPLSQENNAQKAYLICFICGKSVNSIPLLESHIQEHENEKIKELQISQEQTAQLDGTKSEKCNTCEQFFVNLMSYKRHLTSKKHKLNLKLHIALLKSINSTIQPFNPLSKTINHRSPGTKVIQCDICNEFYVAPYGSEDHCKSRRHIQYLGLQKETAPEKTDFKCTICEQSFTNKRNLQDHLNTRTHQLTALNNNNLNK